MAEGLAVPPPGGRWTWPAVAGVLLAAFVAASYSESAGKSPSSDEPPHLASGLAYVERGVFYGNQQHPPLLKELSGLSLLLGGIRLPNTAETELLLSGRRVAAQPEWAAGSQILEKNGYDRTLFWARLPFPLIAAMGGAMIFFLGRRLVGEAAAAGGVFLFAADPTILAHSYLVTTDVGFAAFTMLFLFTLWRYIEKPDARRLVCCGLALGAMLCAKFSAVLLLPVAGVLVLVGLGQRNPAAKPQAVGRNQPCPCGSGKKYKACHGSGEADAAALAGGLGQWRGLIRAGALFLGICGIAYLTIQAIYFLPSDPLVYLEGVRRVNADHIRGYLFMMAGQVREWFVSYFAVAYLLKEPLAGIVLTAIGLATLLRNRAISRLTKLFLLLPPLAVFLGATLWADRMGIRYIMPVLPFAHLLGGYGLATLWSMTAKWARPAAAALCVWVAVATAGIYPDHLSYFNETACLLTAPGKVGMDGGSQCGRFWLDDSNVDWGQGLKQLKRWLDVNAPGRTVRLVNPFHVNPAAYGIKAVDADMLELVRQPQAGLYAVTAHLAARVPVYPGTSRWLKEVEPVALVGHSFFIYDLPGPPAAQ